MTLAHAEAADNFPPTRAEALRRLADFLPRAGRAYAADRNADLGPGHRENVSNLSPYLRYRMISEREVAAAVLERHGLGASQKFIQEVCWRTYWKGWLETRPGIWTRFQAERDVARAEMNGGLAKALRTAEAGATGIEGFDDWARELVETGYMHNHARMWFASIWIFTLRLPWTLGADFFLRHLVDADPASNTLSWRWVAGLQTRGKTYLASADNIARYTGGRFAPRGLSRTAVPLGEEPLPPVRPLAPLSLGSPEKPALLLLTGEDLDPASLFAAGSGICGLIGLRGAAGWPWGARARGFVDAALADAMTRAEGYFGCAGTLMERPDASAIIAAAKSAGAHEIITPYAPVGPVADMLANLSPALEAAGVTLVRRRRAWDERFWPHASRGYFALREQIPATLLAEGLCA